MHQHLPVMYQKFRRVGQLSGVPAGNSGDTGGWEMGADDVGMPGFGLGASDPDDCLPLAMTVKLASI